MRFLALLVLLSVPVQLAWAACSSPTGVAGQFQFISGEYKFCNGSNWLSMGVSTTATACSTAGTIIRSGSDLFFCNGTNLVSVMGSNTDGSCTTPGMITYDTTNLRMEICNGTSWRYKPPATGLQVGITSATASSSTASDPPSNVYDGSTTSIWNAGAYATQWIEVDLGSEKTISKLELEVAQSPDGSTSHTVYVGNSSNPGTSLVTFSGHTTGTSVLTWTGSAGNVRYIRIVTTSSPSWVAWEEIKVFN